MSTPKYIINILTFPHPEETKIFGFSILKKVGQIPLHRDEFPNELLEKYKKELLNVDYLYCDFSTTDHCKFVTSIDLPQSPHFAKHYYNFLIYNYFTKKADIVHPNFIRSTEIWLKDMAISSDLYHEYFKFSITVRIAVISDAPELIISYDGKSKVLKRNIQNLVESDIDTHYLNKLVNNGKITRYATLPPDANNYLSEYYPVLNTGLAQALNFPPVPPKRIDEKYNDYFLAINHLLKKYLNDPEFKKIIPHNESWLELETASICKTSEGTNLLKFAKGTDIDPYEGLKKYKPCVPVPPGHYKFFFICHESDVETAKIFNKYSKKEKGFINFSEFLSLPITYDRDKHILFKDIENPLPEIEERLSNMEFPSDTNYLALYISPYNKYEPNPIKRNFYYQIKQILLRYRVSSQVIYNQNITKDNFKFSVCNIAIAILAKLGGIPWRLDRELDNELIVGIGAFKTRKFNINYIGSTFCFSNDGIFKGFDAFPARNKFLLAGEIRKAVEVYQKENEKAKRLIIHFYKKMSNREINPIIGQLRSLNIDIRVIIVSVNKTTSSDLVLFDSASPYKMPYSGTYMHIGNHNYILCNNARYNPVMDEVEDTVTSANDQVEPKLKSYPLPVKLHVQSTDEEILNDQEQIRLLIDQVYQFSRMYWKSVSQQSLPVTIKYPEMVAEIFPYFKSNKIPDFGKNNLWFL
jgi:hypothetical protein